MVYRTRINYSPAQRAEMWERWKRGESMSSIGRAFGRESSSVFSAISPTGGIRPKPRTRSTRALSLLEREEISRGIATDQSMRTIASRLGRSPSTISREIKRNGGYHHYRATDADQATWDRAHRPKPCKLACYPRLRRAVISKLTLTWSPQQIAGWLKRTYPGEEHKQVSHETIYRSLYIQARGVLKKELQQYLRSQRAIRRSKQHSIKKEGLGQITDIVSISERPAAVEDRAIPGHWEGDMLEGGKQSYIATLVERHSRYVTLVKLNGKEMAGHKRFTLATDIKVYFCDPQSPWQRGSNENTNRLLRQYFPKGTGLSQYSQAKLNAVARQLNERPRKTLGYETPAERFNACVAATG